MNILTRYILKNFFESFLLGFVIFNFMIILTSQLYQVIKWLVDGVYGVIDIAKYLVFISPMYLNYIIPISIVFGVVGSIGRLSSNFEITAINSFGISNMYIFKRLILIVLFISIVHFSFNEFMGYRFVSMALDMYYSSTTKEIRGVIKDFSYIFESSKEVRYVFAKEYSGDLGLMKDVFIVVKDKVSRYISKTVVADWAKKKEENRWLLYNVVTYDYLNKTRIVVNNIEYVFNFENSIKRKKHREELNIFELLRMAREYEKGDFYDLAFDIYVKLNLKFIFPLSSIFLLFLVFPFSLARVRVSNFLGMVLSISVAIVYYVLLTMVQIISFKTGIILFLWLPNFVSIFLGGFLIFLKNKNYV
ncbi:MAG: LptF/LptG family permease [Candidatus Calescibacterium sp.]|nr:LptF/LptG family permease [Candidatus Calescibacterium sp.]